MAEEFQKFHCLVEGDNNVFLVEIAANKQVSDLKDIIYKKRKNRMFSNIKAKDLRLLRVDIDLDGQTRDSLSQLAIKEDGGNQMLESQGASELWQEQPNFDRLHIFVKLPPTTGGKRKRDDPIDISQKLFDLWTAPVQHNINLLQAYLDEPLSPDWKVPLSHFDWKQLLTSEPTGHLACSDQDLELVFRQCDDETAKSIRLTLMATIMDGPPDKIGSEASFHSFWDANLLRNILSVCLDATVIRDSDHGTATGLFRPNFGLLLSDACIFRGEEGVTFTSDPPKEKLRVKTRWVYDPAPYILGYHAVGPVVVLSAILPQGGSLRVVDLIRADLSSRRERIRNASRMIRMCGILRYLRSVIDEGKDRDMFLQFCAGGKSLEFFTSFVRKTYGIGDGVDGEERVKHLRAIYAALSSKGVPHVDRLKDSKIRDYTRGSYVDLEPRGEDRSPGSATDIRNAIVCVLEALKVAHVDPPVFHRDIRWPNVIRNKEDPNNWFLIDWEDASFAPTKAAQHLNPTEHSPKVFEDNHGAEVDMWGVGRLIVTAQTQIPALQNLARKIMGGDILNAEQGLEEINDIQVVV